MLIYLTTALSSHHKQPVKSVGGQLVYVIIYPIFLTTISCLQTKRYVL